MNPIYQRVGEAIAQALFDKGLGQLGAGFRIFLMNANDTQMRSFIDALCSLSLDFARMAKELREEEENASTL